MKKIMFKTIVVKRGEPETKLFDSQASAEEYLAQHNSLNAWDEFEKKLILVEYNDGVETEVEVIDSCNWDPYYFLQIRKKNYEDSEDYVFESVWYDSKERLLNDFSSFTYYIDQRYYEIVIMKVPYDKFAGIYGDWSEDEVLENFICKSQENPQTLDECLDSLSE